MPSLDLYDGGSDPVDHLDHFRTHLSLQGLEDSAMCRCFPLTLKGDARIWFHHLPSGSVSSFRELTDLFLAQYASSRREEKQPWHLSHIKQKPGENPRRFLDHFVAEARRIPKITEEIKAYAAAEEANEAKRPERADQARPISGEGKRKFAGGEHPRQKQRRTGPSERRDYGPTTFTPLTDTRANVLMQIRGEKFLKWPKTLKKDSGNQSKYCDFHHSAGHSTEYYKTLQREIEDLIRRGHLTLFVKGPGQNSGAVDEEGQEQRPPRNRIAAGVVNMITTRLARSPEDSNEQQTGRKKQRIVDNIISFSDCDSNHLKRVFIDNGSSKSLLYLDAFFRLSLKKNQLKPAEGPLYGLDNEPVPVQGTIQLEVTLGTYPKTASRMLTFLVVDLPSVYNAILGRPCLTTFEAVTSIPHLKIKFPTPYGVGEVLGDQVTGRTCYRAQIAPSGRTGTVGELDHRHETTLQQAQPSEATDLVPLWTREPDKCVQIGGSLTGPLRDELITFLRRNADLFAWTLTDMLGISAEVMVHKLGLDPDRKPVRQKRRNHSVEKLIAIREEVKKLLDAGFIREVRYPD
ncbi:hypothetical protein Nepgr_027099 [Nepenthes gracilis]|uniref:Retrotransposon gag domain-containing protein n=1 Tax=Nepenthes gracilis TaxID=150966 RepID=A0AAD3T9W0_NEPGR|nr:hypothetical protein Nepgr_027099 [Nepenthes gracilis]